MPSAPIARIPLSAPARHRVLVIDDDALARRLLSHAFAEQGLDPLLADDGYHGFHRLLDELLHLDLLVTDVNMPGMDGVELIRKIRQLGKERDLAVVAMSAYLDDDLDARLKAAGADAVVDKRVGPERVAALALAASFGRAPRARG